MKSSRVRKLYIQIGRKFKSSKIEFELYNFRSVEFLNYQMKSSRDRKLYTNRPKVQEFKNRVRT